MQRKTALFLLAVTILPLVLGTVYFQYVSSTGGQSTTNYGVIVSPMKKVDNLTTAGFWTFVVVAKECDENCRKRLLSAETTRVLTNENMKRVRTLFISPQALTEEDKPQNLNAKIKTPSDEQLNSEQWQNYVSSFALSEKKLLGSILLVDPLGNFMMHYPQGKQDPKFMLKDMKRLLKYSRIG